MRQSAESESKLVAIGGGGNQIRYEITGADVVREIREETAAEGIVTEVLNDGSAVGERVRFPQLLGGRVREAVENGGAQGVLPGCVDDGFVAEDGVAGGGCREESGKEEKAPAAAGAFWFADDRDYSASTRRFLRFRFRASASFVRRFSPGFR